MRHIAPELKTFIDGKLGAGVVGMDNVALLLAAANSLIGITAVDIDKINLIRSTITKPWGEAWCVDFVQTCVAYVEATKGVATALPPTEGVLDLWHRSEALRTDSPQAGDIILWQLGQTLSGHCGIVTGMDSLLYSTIEGNTSASLGIVRDGDGVFAKKRAKGGTRTFTEVGFLRVFA